jgi:hypothetical protein
MARSGTEKRQRTKSLSMRFNEQEYAALSQLAEHAGLPLSAHVRTVLLNAPASRATRRPTVSHKLAARLVGEIGRVGGILHAAAAAGAVDVTNPAIAAALRDLADMRAVCFEALGRTP